MGVESLIPRDQHVTSHNFNVTKQTVDENRQIYQLEDVISIYTVTPNSFK